ncbi:MAG TPA: SDR family oxidoreductase [Pirellulales bacterium]|jgi:nucleoside-diphosphate-sugar epimerase|nr:SDR family oxidoreductase [Pirellulales bacterium]
MSKLIFGCGYLGARVGRLWRASGEQVYAVTRKIEWAREFERAGYLPIVADVTRPESLARLPAVDTVLFAVGFDRTSGATLEQVYVAGLQAVLDALSSDTKKLVYVSSTGVYGQQSGEVVDEDSPCEPDRAGGRASLAAERLLANHALGTRSIVLRMAGLYGPGRIPNADAIRRDEPLAVPVEGYLNLIHVEDAAQVVVLAAEKALPPKTYIVSDNHPVVRGEYYRELARLLKAPEPRFVAADRDSPVAQRASTSKRVSSDRLLRELELSFLYPDYRAGLAAIFRDDRDASASAV